MTTKTKKEKKPKEPVLKPRVGAVVLEIVPDSLPGRVRAVVRARRELMPPIPGSGKGNRGATVRGCKACWSALERLVGEAELTPREKKHGGRLLHVRRKLSCSAKPAEKLITYCGTCGHKLKAFGRHDVTPEFWDAVPAALAASK